MRKAAGATSSTQIIKHVDNDLTVRVINKKGDITYTFKADGTEFNYIDADGNKCAATAEWSGDNTLLTENVTQTDKDNKQRKVTMERTIVNKEMVLTITNDKGKSMKRIFSKKN